MFVSGPRSHSTLDRLPVWQTLISSGEYFYHSTPVATQGLAIAQIDCQIQEGKPQGNGQNNHFMEFSGPKLAQASIWLTWAMKYLQP